jgi:hypothetical protein
VLLGSFGTICPARLTSTFWSVWASGTLLIFAVLGLIGQDSVLCWTPHPVGYAWVFLILLVAARHFPQLRRQRRGLSALP